MASLYLKLDGITGPSTAANFQGWMELESFALNGAAPVVHSLGSGSGAGSVSMSPLIVVKKPDAASPHLVSNLFTRAHIASGSIAVAQDAGKHPFLQLDLKEVVIVSVSGNYSESATTEQYGLSCGVIQYTYTGTDATGKPTAPVVTGWNLEANAKI